MRVLAFEDSYDIEQILVSGNVDINQIELIQYWDSSEAQEKIGDCKPDILLLDHYMPPKTGLQVLQELNINVEKGNIFRPNTIVGMSTSSLANEQMAKFGADYIINKFSLSELKFWPKLN